MRGIIQEAVVKPLDFLGQLWSSFGHPCYPFARCPRAEIYDILQQIDRNPSVSHEIPQDIRKTNSDIRKILQTLYAIPNPPESRRILQGPWDSRGNP
eukprot:5465358-Pyramimonas_sp.AAC.1